ncbi:MAG: hypothetical protein ABIF09_16925 [Gemmatimonadota bacterium]
MTRLHRYLLVPGLALLVLSFAPLQAQETPPPTSPPQRPDSVDLVFQREAFFYPGYERRNPFAPLQRGNESGPRIEDIRLIGIIYSSNPDLSVASFGPRTSPAGEGSGVQSYRVRRGDTLGNIRILEIQQRRVVVQIEEFGQTEQRIMELQRPGQGGL